MRWSHLTNAGSAPQSARRAEDGIRSTQRDHERLAPTELASVAVATVAGGRRIKGGMWGRAKFGTPELGL